jgi:hypothetical protein
MARAGLAYAAMLAASVSAGALGYAVIWAFAPEEQAALAPSVSAAVALPVAVAAQPEPPGLAAVVAAAQASAPEPKPEPVTASAPAMAAAPAPPAEPPKHVAPAVAPRAKAEPVAPARAQPHETVVVPQARPTDVVRQSAEIAPAAPLPAAGPIVARPVEGRQTRPLPGVVTPLPAEAPVVRPSPSAAVAPREHAPVGSTMRPAPPATSPEPLALPNPSAAARFAALPPAQEMPQAPAVASDAPQILIVRGGLRRATSVRPQRLNPVPAPDPAVHDAPRITVLRGGGFRSAHTALLPVVQPLAIAVVRGTRPATAPSLAKLSAPGPLVLRIRD